MRKGEADVGELSAFGLIFEALLLAFEKLIQFFDELEKTVAVSFLLNQCT